jgi:hypothetical protein
MPTMPGAQTGAVVGCSSALLSPVIDCFLNSMDEAGIAAKAFQVILIDT